MIITTAFILIAAAVLWFVIGISGRWVTKAALIAVTIGLAASTWSALSDYAGYPADGVRPPEFELRWAMVDEPNDSIYLLVNNTKEQGKPPRYLRVPYTTELHRSVEKALDLIKNGKRVGGRKPTVGAVSGQEKNTVDGGRTKGSGSESNVDEFMLYELPPPVYPSK